MFFFWGRPLSLLLRLAQSPALIEDTGYPGQSAIYRLRPMQATVAAPPVSTRALRRAARRRRPGPGIAASRVLGFGSVAARSAASSALSSRAFLRKARTAAASAPNSPPG